MAEMTLALGTALLLERLRQQERRPHDETSAEPGEHPRVPSAEADRALPERVRTQRFLALRRILNADCPSCRGFGCVVCAGTGMA